MIFFSLSSSPCASTLQAPHFPVSSHRLSRDLMTTAHRLGDCATAFVRMLLSVCVCGSICESFYVIVYVCMCVYLRKF